MQAGITPRQHNKQVDTSVCIRQNGNGFDGKHHFGLVLLQKQLDRFYQLQTNST